MTMLSPARGALPHARPASAGTDLAALVLAAQGRDDAAWRTLVRRFEPMMRRTARGYRLSPAQIDDAVQGTWIRLVRSIDGVREPACLAGWLATAVRRESLRLLQTPIQEMLSGDAELGGGPDTHQPEAEVIDAEARALLAAAFAKLPVRHARLMTLMLAEPALNYHELSARTGIPVGSIGPIRGRSLARLAQNPALLALHAVGSD